MTDQQLLKAAAQVAGLKVQRSRLSDPMCRDFLMDGEGARNPGQKSYPWNPLNDDGDALRLAIKLGIEIGDFHQYGRALATRGHTRGWGEFWEAGPDPFAATRRAIVRAAASMIPSPAKDTP